MTRKPLPYLVALVVLIALGAPFLSKPPEPPKTVEGPVPFGLSYTKGGQEQDQTG